MAVTTFDDTTQWGVITKNLTLTSNQVLAIRMSELVIASLRASGLLSTLVISDTAPADISVPWLDENTDPNTLRVYDLGLNVWRQVTFADFFGRMAGSTNITITETAFGVNFTSSTGTGDTLALVTEANAGAMSPADKGKLNTVVSGAEPNVQADWDETTPTSDAFIRNKPDVGADLSVINRSATGLTIRSNTGTDAVLSAATSLLAGLITGSDQTKLDNIQPGAEVNVQANWDETDTGSDAFIRNKPSMLGTNLAITQSGTTVTIVSSTGDDAVIPAASSSAAGVFSVANFTKLAGIEAGAEVNVQADWNETNTGSDAFIRNKPSVQPAIQFMEDGVDTILGPVEVNFTGANVDTSAVNGRLNVDVTGGGVGGITNISISRTANTVTVASDTGTDGIIAGASTTLAGAMVSADKSKLDGIAAGAQVNVDTDLSLGPSAADSVTIMSSTGDDVTLNAASITAAGVLTTLDFIKLAGIAAGAEVNVQADWDETNVNSDAFIQNKPEVGADLSVTRTGSSVTVASDTGTDAVIAAADSSNAGVMPSADKNKLDGIEPGAQVNVSTDLSFTRTGTSVTVASSTGDDVILPAANTSNAGVMTSANYNKLNGIEAGAEVNRDIATQAEAEAGTNNTDSMTPLRVAQAIEELAPGAGADVYTGSNVNQTIFPVGHTILIDGTALRNSSVPARLQTDNNNHYTRGGTGAMLAGTWRARGSEPLNIGHATLIQRTA